MRDFKKEYNDMFEEVFDIDEDDEYDEDDFPYSEYEDKNDWYFEKTEKEDIPDRNVITVTDESGEELRARIIDSVEYENEKYVIVVLQDESGSIVIFKAEYANGETHYVYTEDDETMEAVFEIYKDKFLKDLTNV